MEARRSSGLPLSGPYPRLEVVVKSFFYRPTAEAEFMIIYVNGKHRSLFPGMNDFHYRAVVRYFPVEVEQARFDV